MAGGAVIVGCGLLLVVGETVGSGDTPKVGEAVRVLESTLVPGSAAVLVDSVGTIAVGDCCTFWGLQAGGTDPTIIAMTKTKILFFISSSYNYSRKMTGI